MSLNREQRRVVDKEIKDVIERESRRIMAEMTAETNSKVADVVDIAMTMAAYVLHFDFGFGHDRVGRFLETTEKYSDDILSERLSLEECKKALWDEIKIKIN